MTDDYQAIPEILRGRPQFVVWRYRQQPGSPKPKKVPFSPRHTDQKASVTDPRTWGTFEEAVAAVRATAREPGKLRPVDGLGFVFKPAAHDKGEKNVLGHRITAGRGIEDGEEVLDILARHPSTARFIAMKLVRRFVADEPPRPLVDRAARTFRRTDGDLREVMQTILQSREFYAAAARRAKIKSPLEYVASALRATDADVRNPRAFVGTISALGEPLYQSQPPTGYPDRASVWINTGTLVDRLNFAQGLAANGLNASTIDRSRAEAALKRLLPDAAADDSSPVTRLALLLGSPAFQRR